MLKLWPKPPNFHQEVHVYLWLVRWLQHFSTLFNPGVKHVFSLGMSPPRNLQSPLVSCALFSLPMIMEINKNQVGMVYLYPWHLFKHILAYFGSNVGWSTGKFGGPRAPGTKWRRQSPVRAAWPSSPKPNDGNDHSTSTGLWFQTCSVFWCRIKPIWLKFWMAWNHQPA